MLKYLGCLLIALPIIVIFVAMAVRDGIVETIFTFGIAVSAVACVRFGFKLIEKEDE